jgi:predicted GNAT superfamily acetyltransferase
MADWVLQILEKPDEMEAVEGLQRLVWAGAETDVVPAHMLLAAIHNGGLLIGAFEGASSLVGFVFGFPGLYSTPDGPRPKHCSHLLAVHPDTRSRGLGFALKRAQWQMVRHQGLDRITWTYDPLLSRNAYLNIARLGAVCSTYLRDEYGSMRDEMNQGLPSDRFQVDWWVNSKRVIRRLSKRPRLQLDLAHFLAAGVKIINPSHTDGTSWPRPGSVIELEVSAETLDEEVAGVKEPLALIEIPADFLALKAAEPALSVEWRSHTRALFEDLFQRGYLVTDFIHLPGATPRSFYVLSHGESTL